MCAFKSCGTSMVQVINDIGQVKQAPFVFVLLMAASLSGNDFEKNLATLGHFVIWTAQKLGYQFTDPKNTPRRSLLGGVRFFSTPWGLLRIHTVAWSLLPRARRCPVSQGGCGCLWPGLLLCPNQIGKKTVFWSWVVGGLAEFTGVGWV